MTKHPSPNECVVQPANMMRKKSSCAVHVSAWILAGMVVTRNEPSLAFQKQCRHRGRPGSQDFSFSCGEQHGALSLYYNGVVSPSTFTSTRALRKRSFMSLNVEVDPIDFKSDQMNSSYSRMSLQGHSLLSSEGERNSVGSTEVVMNVTDGDARPSAVDLIPSAADLVIAAEEGLILPSNVLNPLSRESEGGFFEAKIAQERKNVLVDDLSDIPVSSEQVGVSSLQMNDVASKFTPADVGEEERPLDSPGVAKIIRFAVPAIGVWLCSPILSMIDTSAVGLLAGTAHQAALSPAVAVSDYGALLLAFLYTGTTNLVAGAWESDKNDIEKRRTAKTLTASLQLSVYVGLCFSVALLALSRILLRNIIGNDTIDPLVFNTALKYVRIRALGMPAAAMIGSAQAACLGMQDTKSPLYVLAAAAVVNFIGDFVFVGNRNPWIGGAPGAAWATVFSQYAAMTMFLKWLTSFKIDSTKAKPTNHRGLLRRRSDKMISDDTYKPKKNLKVLNLTRAILSQTSSDSTWAYATTPIEERDTEKVPIYGETPKASHTSSRGSEMLLSVASKLRKMTLVARIKELNRKSTKESKMPFSVRGFLKGRFRKRDAFRIPNRSRAVDFWPYVLPVTTTSVGRVSSYVAMSHVVSSCLGCAAMAAQQVILSIFCCLCPVADALNLTAQSFVPALFERENSKERAAAIRKISTEFVKAGSVFGAFLVGAVSCIPLLTSFFTADPMVMAQVNAVVPLLAVCFSVHGVLCAMEGVMLGQKDLGFLGKAYAFFFVAVPWFMLRVKKAVLFGGSVPSLTSVWKVFAGYQLFRIMLFVSRVKFLAHRVTVRAANSQGTNIKVIDDIGINAVGKSLTEVDGVSEKSIPMPKEITVSQK